MDLSTKMIVDTSKLHLKLIEKKNFNVASFEDNNDDFSDFIVKNVTVFDYEVVELEDLEKAGIGE